MDDQTIDQDGWPDNRSRCMARQYIKIDGQTIDDHHDRSLMTRQENKLDGQTIDQDGFPEAWDPKYEYVHRQTDSAD